MTLACVLAIASTFVNPALPRPKPYSWVDHIVRTGDSEFDSFCIKVVGLVRRADWDSLAPYCLRRVKFEVYEAWDSKQEGSRMLFDDTVSDDDNPMQDYHLKALQFDTSRPLSNFAKSQFSYFAALVEGSVQSPQSVPRWSRNPSSSGQSSADQPVIWGPYAANANWRIELDRTLGSWRVGEFVIEYH